MKALIFAAGLGTRLRPITDSIPKALVPVGGVPMLQRVICKLRDAGLGPFVVNTHHFAEKIASFLEENGNFGTELSLSPEPDGPLETGGGIRRAAPLLGKGRFLVHNVDILSNLDIQWLLSKDRPGSLATLVLTETEADRYLLFDEGMRLVGWTNVRTGEVKSPFHDFEPGKYRRYSFCGIHIISSEVFPMMEAWPEKFSIIDFYLKAAATHPIYGVVAADLKLIDIGSPEKLAEADALFLK
ncbi:MAG: nucleotidyltransferase family protein [Bacteroidales bacterium]|nr:nucleotidyltransferase family protein [Candidatus Cryptobacteroides equifaecalis]